MSTLWLPRTITDDTPRFRCRLCKAAFTQREQRSYERHVRSCYVRQESELHERGPRTAEPALLGDQGVDTEFLAWHKLKGDNRDG